MKLQITVMCLVGGLSACSSDKGRGGLQDQADVATEKAVLRDAATAVIIPTYQQLAVQADGLSAAAQTFGKDRTAANLASLRTAWVRTRSPWEQGEAFLFGPVETSGYDAGIDSWPLNKTDLQAVMDSSLSLTEATVGSRGNNEKGFHTVEYLIYGERSDKTPAQFNDREIEYMTGASQNLSAIATALVASWDKGSSDKPAYKDTLASAGDAGNTVYPSRSAALQELVASMAKICHEVAVAKIGTPFDAADANLVESQFSYNSLIDFADNIRSVDHIYQGRFAAGATQGVSLSELVAKTAPALDQKIKEQIAASIVAIQKIPEPFPVSLKDKANSATIRAAQDAIGALESTLIDEVGKIVTR